jgi:hypothetical protein
MMKMMTSGARPRAGPVTGSAWQDARPGQPRPLAAATLTLAALPAAPSRARRYTRSFLGSYPGITQDTAETAELLVCELVTNAVRFTGNPARAPRYPGPADAALISLSLRHFREALLIEVHDTSSTPPSRSSAGKDAESGRGLILIDALSTEWSYFFPPGGGKVVYCLLEIPPAATTGTSATPSEKPAVPCSPRYSREPGGR